MVATYNHLIIHKQDDSKIENQDIAYHLILGQKRSNQISLCY